MSGEGRHRTFYCSDELWAACERLAWQTGRAVDDVLNEALARYVRGAASGQPQMPGPPPLPMPGAPPNLPPTLVTPQLPGRPPFPPPPPAPPRPPSMAPAPMPPQMMPPLPPQPPQRMPGPPMPPQMQQQPMAPPMPPHMMQPQMAPPMPPMPPPQTGTPPPPGYGQQAPSYGYPRPGPPAMESPRPPTHAPPPQQHAPPQQQHAPPGPMSDGPPTYPLFLYYEGQRVQIMQPRFVLGRSRSASDFAINDSNVSRQHAAVEWLRGHYHIVDLGSTNGVQFNGRRVERKVIYDGDVLVIAGHQLRFARQ